MTEFNLQTVVEDANRRLRELHERAGSPRIHERGILPETFEELKIALEELSLASEELQQQNSALFELHARLEEEHSKYLAVFNSIPTACIVANLAGKIQEANSAAADMTSLRREQLRGKNLKTLVAKHDRDRFLNHLTDLQNSNSSVDLHIDMMTGNGATIPASISAFPFQDRSGNTAGVRWLLRDLSVVRQLEMEQQERLKEKSQWVEESKAFERDHVIAQQLQSTLMSTKLPADYDRLEIASVYRAALNEAHVGGDYYDMFRLPESNKIALIVGDAIGKGLSAATLTAQIKFALRAFLWETNSASKALSKLNDFVIAMPQERDQPYPRLVALTIALIDEQEHSVALASAGAEPCLILRSNRQVEQCKSEGLLIGVQYGYQYPEIPYDLDEGDIMLLYTDGLSEAHKEGGAVWGVDGVCDTIVSCGNSLRLHELAQRILQDAENHAGGAAHDDVCILLAKRK